LRAGGGDDREHPHLSNRRLHRPGLRRQPGRYSVSVYFDENDSGEFDQALFGIPLEDFGFSNDATVFLSPPSFGEVQVSVPEEGVQITIHMD